jgi:hypothetical protein
LIVDSVASGIIDVRVVIPMRTINLSALNYTLCGMNWEIFEGLKITGAFVVFGRVTASRVAPKRIKLSVHFPNLYPNG